MRQPNRSSAPLDLSACPWGFILNNFPCLLLLSMKRLNARSGWLPILPGVSQWHGSPLLGFLRSLWWCAVFRHSVTSTLCDLMDCSRQAPLSMGILQAGILACVTMPSARRSSQPRDQTQISRIAGGFFTIWAIREACSNHSHTFKKIIIYLIGGYLQYHSGFCHTSTWISHGCT